MLLFDLRMISPPSLLPFAVAAAVGIGKKAWRRQTEKRPETIVLAAVARMTNHGEGWRGGVRIWRKLGAVYTFWRGGPR